ncbi:MAG TPA: hypothetical protein VIT67_22530, partial [Povalibacter sp.]
SGWFEITFGPSGVVHFTSENIGKYLLPYPGGTYIFVMMSVGAVVGLLGPVGLFLGLRYVLLGRALQRRALGYGLIAAMLLYNVIGTVAGYLVGPPEFAVHLTETLLFSILPVAAIFHLMHLADPPPQDSSTAVAMAA